MGHSQKLAKILSASGWHTQGFGLALAAVILDCALPRHWFQVQTLALQSMLIRGLKVPLLCEFCFSFCVASWESYKEVRTCCNTILASKQARIRKRMQCKHQTRLLLRRCLLLFAPRVNFITTTSSHMQVLSLLAFCSVPCSARVQMCTCISILPATMH